MRVTRMSKHLFTWRLAPSTVQSDLWQVSSYRGEVWVRACDSVQARILTADQFRCRSDDDDGPSKRQSPWYARQLVKCEQVSAPSFDRVELPGVVHMGPVKADRLQRSEAADEAPVIPGTLSGDAAASHIRQSMVAMLLARGVNTPGRWLDVYITRGKNGATAFRIVPARGMRRAIAKLLRHATQRRLEVKDGGWVVSEADINGFLKQS
jgi:hypothetical protein